jgi:hypothetical protein
VDDFALDRLGHTGYSAASGMAATIWVVTCWLDWPLERSGGGNDFSQ